MRKRILAVLLCATMAMSMFAGCSKGGDAEPTGTPTSAPTPEAQPDNKEEENNKEEQTEVTLDLSSALDITSTLKVNDEGTYLVEEVNGGYKVTATETKGEWAFFWFAIDQDVKDYAVVEFVVEGAAGINYLTKLEGGGATAVEVARTLSGSEETIQWEVSADNLTSAGGEMFLIFLNQGVAGATAGNPESITIKSVKLYKKGNGTTTSEPAGTETAALDITSTLAVNEEGTYTLEAVNGAQKVTATATKGEWSFVYFTIDGDAKAYNAVELVVEGKAGTNYLLKLEGGDAAAVESAYTLSGSEETITWSVSADNFTSKGEQKLIIFLNQGQPGATAGAEEYITVKSVKLITK